MLGEKQSRKAAWQEYRRIRQIRTRASYHLFKELYDFLETNRNIADILRKLYEILDSRHGFGSRTNAVYAAESLEQVLKDNGEVKR